MYNDCQLLQKLESVTHNKGSSADVIHSIALKLKYYFAKKRREDGFDLSPSNLPQQTFPKLSPRRMLQTCLQDLPLKHHFSHSHIRGMVARIQSSKSCTDLCCTTDRSKNIQQAICR